MSKRARANPVQFGGQQMKKLAVSGVLVGSFLFYSLLHSRSNAAALGSVPSGSGGLPSSSPIATLGGDATPVPSATSAPGSAYKDGSYTGGVADAQWGYVQVKVTIANGRMTNVQFVDYPHDRNRSIMINQYADPVLVQEAIQAQSAQVDIVTGATDTSFAFMQSLDDALSHAQA
jgi:uncharacterized protein with FMN-binding domain